jgi:hypothetical protein
VRGAKGAAAKLGRHAAAAGAEGAALVSGDRPVDDFAIRAEGRERRYLIRDNGMIGGMGQSRTSEKARNNSTSTGDIF